MIDLTGFARMDPYVRMMRVKKMASLSGTWRDFDNVFTYIAAGSADFILDGNRYPLYTGSAILIPPYMTHMIVSKGAEPLVQYIIHFDFFETEDRKKLENRDVLDEPERRIPVPERERILENHVILSEIPETKRNRLIGGYLKMNREFQERRPLRELMLKSGCMELLVITLRNCVDVAGGVDGGGRRTKSWIHIENAIDYIQGCDSCGQMDNESIALAIGVSPNYLTGIFQACLGISLHKFVMNVRVERAQQLLLSGTRNITEVANQTGFSSIHVFSKSFKNILGVSPSQFLEEVVNKESIAEYAAENTGENMDL